MTNETMLQPKNRMLLLEKTDVQEEAQENAVLLPKDYNPVREQYEVFKIKAIAPDCNIDLDYGSKVVVEANMLKMVQYGGEIFYLIHEAHVLAVISRFVFSDDAPETSLD